MLTRKNKICFTLKCRKYPRKAIKEVFSSYNLDDIRGEIQLWKEIAVVNDMSAYDDGESRENLFFFCSEFLKMVEALYLLYEQHLSTIKSNQSLSLTKEAISIINENNKIISLTEEEEQNPLSVLETFFSSFSLAYSKREIQDMIEAVISYEGRIGIDKRNLIVMFKSINYLLGASKSLLIK